VALADGTEFHAPIVVSALDPRRTFLELVEAARAADRPRRHDRTLSGSRATSAKGQLRARRCAALSGPRRPTDQYRGFTNIGPSMEYLERAYDDAKLRLVLEEAVSRLRDPVDGGTRDGAPRQGVMSSFVQYAPYHLRESDWDTEKERLGDTVQADARVVLPGLRRSSSCSARSGRRSTSSGRSA
jgi:phytoene dehydrogenase-like protein